MLDVFLDMLQHLLDMWHLPNSFGNMGINHKANNFLKKCLSHVQQHAKGKANDIKYGKHTLHMKQNLWKQII